MKLTIICVICMSVQFGIAQDVRFEKKIDSLTNEFRQAKTDSAKVVYLLELGKQYAAREQYQEAVNYGNEALLVAENNNLTNLAGKTNSFLGGLFFSMGNTRQALHHQEEAMDNFKILGNEYGVAIVNINMGNIHAQTGNFPEALKKYSSGLEILTQQKSTNLQDKRNIAGTTQNISRVYAEMGDFVNSIKYTLDALKIFSELKDSLGMAESYLDLGGLYSSLSQAEESLMYYQSALTLFEKYGNKGQRARIYSQLGVLYNRLNYPDESIEYQLKAKDLFEELNYAAGTGAAYLNLGAVYNNIGESDKALDAYIQAIRILEQINHRSALIPAYAGKGAINMQRGQLTEASVALNKAYMLAGELGRLENQKGILADLIMLDTLNKDFQAAYQHQLLYHQLTDSIFNLEKDKKITELIMQHRLDNVQDSLINVQTQKESAYEYQKQLRDAQIIQQAKDLLLNQNALKLKDLALKVIEGEKEVERLAVLRERTERENKEAMLAKAEQEKKTQALMISGLEKDKELQASVISNTRKNRNILLGSLLAIFVFTGAFIYFRNQNKRLLLEKKITETELNVFRAQMNPHFMFNALNSIHSYILSNHPKMATAYLEKFSKLMRMILENSTNPLVSLADDLNALQLYLDLEANRLDNSFSHRINVENDLDIHGVFVPPLILQPFVENSIWHGLANKDKDGEVKISIYKQGNLLKCQITDNGSGLQKTNKTGKSYGIQITRQRIENLNKAHKTEGYCHLEELFDSNKLPMGIKVEVGLPLITDAA